MAIVAGCALLFLAAQSFSRPSEVPVIEVDIIDTYDHDNLAFVQGLLYHDGKLYESTGRKGQSTVRILDLERKEPAIKTALDDDLFGEGIVIWEDRLIQLTWQDEKVLEFDPSTLELIKTHDLEGEGWGLTHNDEHLIMSDGSSRLRFLDPDTLETVRTIAVRMDGRRVPQLNELEYANGHIYANIWHKDYVVKIDPDTGNVIGKVDLANLIPRSRRADDAVLNGIAYDKENNRWFVTGKLWPTLFEVHFKE